MSSKPITIAVYPDGLLITIDGKSYLKTMTAKQKLSMAKEIISRVVSDSGDECLELDTLQSELLDTQLQDKSENT
jgi:hypothetical protein